MLKDSLMPGYPRESGEKALATWCALLSGADLSSEQTPAEVDEKIFVMRPYVFACAKVSCQFYLLANICSWAVRYNIRAMALSTLTFGRAGW